MAQGNPRNDKTEVIRQILSTQLACELVTAEKLPSNNSVVYKVSIKPLSAARDDVKRLKQTALHGTAPLPQTTTTFIIRFSNPGAMLNDAVAIESEVASLALARDALRGLSANIVPNVYGWKAASADEPGWILLEDLPGITLGDEGFENLPFEAKKDIVDQVAQIYKLIQDYQLPESVKGYGGLAFAPDGSIVTGPTPVHGATKSCNTFHQLYTEYLATQLHFMDKCDVVQGWKNTGLRARIDVFVAEGFEQALKDAIEAKPRQTFVHGDLDVRNLLFDPETDRITGLLDFSFSHIGSPLDEYFVSFNGIHGHVPPPAHEPAMVARRNYLLYGPDAVSNDVKTAEGFDWEVASLRDTAFSQVGVKQPVDFMPEIDKLSELHYFIQNISPGLFFMDRTRNQWTIEQATRLKKMMQRDLEERMDRWGY